VAIVDQSWGRSLPRLSTSLPRSLSKQFRIGPRPLLHRFPQAEPIRCFMSRKKTEARVCDCRRRGCDLLPATTGVRRPIKMSLRRCQPTCPVSSRIDSILPTTWDATALGHENVNAIEASRSGSNGSCPSYILYLPASLASSCQKRRKSSPNRHA